MMGRHAGINAIGQQYVVFLVRLDDRCCMDAGTGAEGILTDDRVVLGDRNSSRLRHRLAIIL